ncbi:MAG: right-handed parallel beta-helix repeat-containing protein [Promethearchaeota archaeon]
MKKGKLFVLFMLFLLILLFQGKNPNTTLGLKNELSTPLMTIKDISSPLSESISSNLTKFGYSAQAPIYIPNNTALMSAGFPGSGSEVDPYRLENYNITSDLRVLIHIKNTTSHFIIQHSLLNGVDNDYSGIVLENVINGRVYNTTIQYCFNGIELQHSNSNVVDYNTIHKNGKTSAKPISGGSGIYLTSNFNTITNNNIEENLWYGVNISSSSSENNTVKENCFKNNGGTSSQAYDNGANNTFIYNYWDDWISGYYSIDGSANNNDTSPLAICPTDVPNGTPSMTFPIVISSLLIIVIFVKVRSKHRKSKNE